MFELPADGLCGKDLKKSKISSKTQSDVLKQSSKTMKGLLAFQKSKFLFSGSQQFCLLYPNLGISKTTEMRKLSFPAILIASVLSGGTSISASPCWSSMSSTGVGELSLLTVARTMDYSLS